jgi:integrase
MASIKVVLYTSKTLSNGEHPIMLRVIKDRKTKYITLGLNCTKALWNSKENLPQKKHPLYSRIVNKINKEKHKASKMLIDLENESQELSADQIKNKLKSEIKDKKTVFQYFDELISRFEKGKRIGYANIFKSTKNSLINFKNDFNLPFSEITPAFIIKYEENFYSRGVKPNSVFVFLRTLKTLINYARKDGIVKSDYNPFHEISFSKFRRIKTAKRALSIEQMRKIRSLEIEEGTSLFHAKNYFLFSYYNRGINFIDMAHLTWENIKNGRLYYERKKTKEQLNMELLLPAKEILEYYKTFKPQDSRYIFPILTNKYESPKSIDNRLNKMLKKVNDDLKIISQMAGIEEKITTYVARHTYATVMKKSGVPVSIISEALGHENEKTTQIYLDSFENSVIDEASKKIL